jgi:hypothetical protein
MFAMACADGIGPQFGSMSVTVVTEGADLPTGPYSMVVDGKIVADVATNSLTGIPVIRTGRRTLRLDGLPPNCSGADEAVTVEVRPDAATDVTFRVSCVRSMGILEIATSTNGADQDVDGFRLVIDGVDYGGVPATGEILVEGVPAGARHIGLSNVAANCRGAVPVALSIAHGRTHAVAFVLQCAPSESSLRLTTSTTGLGRDPDGYVAHVNGRPYAVPVSGSVVIAGLPADRVVLTLDGVAENCSPRFPIFDRVLARGREELLQLDIRCESFTSAVDIITVTTGSNVDVDGYFVEIHRAPSDLYGPQLTVLPVAPNGVVRHGAMHAGTTAVLRLTGLQPNCRVLITNQRQLTLAENTVLPVRFDVVCVEAGQARVTVTAVGDGRDSDGYLVEAVGHLHVVPAIPNGSVVLPGLLPGDNRLRLVGLNPNCAVLTENPVTVSVVAGGTAEAAFTVSCVADPTALVTVNAQGSHRDPSGFQVVLQRGSNRRVIDIPPEGGGNLMDFLPETGEWTATLHGIAENCEVLPASATQQFSASFAGVSSVVFDVTCVAPSQLAFAMRPQTNWDIFTILSDGSGLANVTQHPGNDMQPTWSAQGRIAFASDRSGTFQVYAMESDGSNISQITHGGGSNHSPTWSPDGSRLAYVSDRNGVSQIFVINADGSQDALLTDAGPSVDPAWSPDGSHIAFALQIGGTFQLHIWYWEGVAVWYQGQLGATRYPSWTQDSQRISALTESCSYYYGCYEYLGITPLDGSGFSYVASSTKQSSWNRDGSRVAIANDCGPQVCTAISILRTGGSAPEPLLNGSPVSHPSWRR